MNRIGAFKDWVKQWTARLVRYGILAQTDPTGFDQMEGTLGEAGDASFQHPIRRFQHYGFRSRPQVGAELICVAPRAGTSNRVSIASEVPGQGPSFQEEGEVEIYSEFGQRIVLSRKGSVMLQTKAGNEVVLAEDGTVTLRESLGGQAQFKNQVFRVDTAVESQHFQGRGALPVVIPGPGLGGGTVSLLGSDAGCTLRMTVVRAGPGQLAIVLFDQAYRGTPTGVGLCALDSVTAKAMILTPFYVWVSPVSLQIFADGLAPGFYQMSAIIVG